MNKKDTEITSLPENLLINTWWKPGGGMMYNRSCLEPTHPEHLYNYVKREFKVDPELYGIKKPTIQNQETCPHCGKLIRSNENEEDEDYDY